MLIVIARVIILALLGYGLFLFLMQRKMLYPAPKGRLPPLPPGVVKVPLSHGYGLFMSALGDGERPAPALIFMHGNAESADLWLDAFEPLRAEGLAIFLLEFPGYGEAPGKPSLASMRDAGLAAFDFLKSEGSVDGDRVLAYGRSIGSGPACLLAESRPLAALGLESAFSSLPRLVKDHGQPSFLLLDRFDNQSIVAGLDVPVFIYHGAGDEIIDVEHAYRLRAAAKRPTYVETDCGHNNCPRPWPEFLAFLREAGVLETKDLEL